MAKRKNNGKFWVAKSDEQYIILEKEPDAWSMESWGGNKEIYCDNYSDIEFCESEFEQLTGIKLEPGQFAEVRLSVVGSVWETTAEEEEHADNQV